MPEETFTIEDMIVPSIQTIHNTYEVLRCLTQDISEDSKAIIDTLQVVCDLLDAIDGSNSPANSLQGLGLITLPLPVVLLAVSATLSKYIQNRTGISLKSWSEFVRSSQVQFDQYLTQLGKIAELSTQNNKSDEEAIKFSPEQLYHAEELLENTKLKTKLWRPIMIEITKLNQLFDSILEFKVEDTQSDQQNEEISESVESKRGLGSKLKGMAGSLKNQATKNESIQKSWEQMIAKHIRALRKRVDQLGDQIERLSNSMFGLEELLDLEIAQIKSLRGEITDLELDVLSKRIAVTITIPQLINQLKTARQDVANCQKYLQNLNTRYQQNEIKTKVYETLKNEYQASLDTTNSTLSTLERRASAWKNKGRPTLETGKSWLKMELDIVRARKLVEEIDNDEAQQREKVLKREIKRFEEAEKLLDNLKQTDQSPIG